jgi:hypothetical protein
MAAINDNVLNSLVFTRNQIIEEYLSILKNYGIKRYCRNPASWIHKPRKLAAENL